MPSFAQVIAEGEEGVAAIATGVASGAGADLALGDLAADVIATVKFGWSLVVECTLLIGFLASCLA
jgi:hypothetical protein